MKSVISIPVKIETQPFVWMGATTLRVLKNNLVMDLDITGGSIKVVKEIPINDDWTPASFSPDGNKIAFHYNIAKDNADWFEGYFIVVVYDILNDRITYIKDRAENHFLYCKNLYDAGSLNSAKQCFSSFMKKYPVLKELCRETRQLVSGKN